jgi:hypothetical protein
MSTLNFPNNPSLNESYTQNDNTFIWNGFAWISQYDDIFAASGVLAEIDSRSQVLSVSLTAIQQVYLQYDGTTFRNNTAIIESRSGNINVLV